MPCEAPLRQAREVRRFYVFPAARVHSMPAGIAAILLLVVVCECLPGENLAQRAHTREQERREAADSMQGEALKAPDLMYAGVRRNSLHTESFGASCR